VSHAGGDCQQPDRDAGPVGEAEPAEHEEEQHGDPQFDQKRERRQIADSTEDDQLQRARLQLGVGEGVRPPAGEQLLALVDEVDKVAGVRPSIEVSQAGGRA